MIYNPKTGIKKQAGAGELAKNLITAGDTAKAVMSIGGLLFGAGGLAMKRIFDKINNDTRRKALIEDLANNDPLLKDIDKATVMQWYASIYRVAPSLSMDKSTVREVLHTFARFGRVDMQTLKMLSETEKNISSQGVGNSWSGILTGAVR